MKHSSIWLWLSIGLNLLLSLMLGAIWLNRLDQGSGRLGITTRDICASAKTRDVLVSFCLPKGLTVQDVSPHGIGGIGLFEPHHYSLVLTTGDPSVVAFNSTERKMNPWGELYSIEERK